VTGLAEVFDPRGIVVVGASNRETNLGLRFTRALTRHGYPGALAVVNRAGEDVEGLPGFGSVAEVATPFDLAVIAVAAGQVEETVAASAEAGAKAALVFTSGFAELGPEGEDLQRRLVDRAAAVGIRLMGPNCVGFANVRAHVCPIASGFGFRAKIEPGSLAIVTQSGGVAGLLGERAQDIGIGLSHVVTTGNEADVTAAEILSYLATEPETKEVAIYLEAVRRPQELAEALASLAKNGVRTAIFKAGAGRSTAAAAAAHTGAVVGDDESFDAFCRQTGARRVHDLDHLFLVPPIAAAGARSGPRVAVLSTSGGAAVAVADACERAGLDLPPLSAATRAAVAEKVPDFASTGNPIDISGMFVVAMDQFRDSLRTLLAAPEFDAVVMVQTVHAPELAERIADLVIETGNPQRMLVAWIAGEQSSVARARLRAAGYAVSESATALAAGLRAGIDADATGPVELRFPPPSAPTATAPEPASRTLQRLSQLLPAGAGFGVPALERAIGAEQVAAAAARVGYPLVLKGDDAGVAHKTEGGGVVTGVADERALAAGIARLQAAGFSELLVQRQVEGARELLLSAKLDPAFGLSLALGFGGVLTEAIGRGAAVLPPLDPAAIGAALEAAGLGPAIGEFRGAAAIDLEALTALSTALLDLAERLSGARLVELNPVIVDAGGAPWAVDALVETQPLEA
jgi:acyl-CoA synthetase (NDP forming)